MQVCRRRDQGKLFQRLGYISVAQPKVTVSPLFVTQTKLPFTSLAKCVLAVCGVTLARRANSPAINAISPINTESIAARAGSAINAAIVAQSGFAFISEIVSQRCFDADQNITVLQ